jgi:hypothetical protein
LQVVTAAPPTHDSAANQPGPAMRESARYLHEIARAESGAESVRPQRALICRRHYYALT